MSTAFDPAYVACCERCKWWTGASNWVKVKAKNRFPIHVCTSPRWLYGKDLTERTQAGTVFEMTLATGPDFACAFYEEEMR